MCTAHQKTPYKTCSYFSPVTYIASHSRSGTKLCNCLLQDQAVVFSDFTRFCYCAVMKQANEWDEAVAINAAAVDDVVRVRITEFHDALNAMQRTMERDNNNNMVSQYRLITSMHQFSEAPGAHNGPAFLPWHREYLRRLVAIEGVTVGELVVTL